MRIRITTRPGASPHPLITTATNHGARPDPRWVPSPPVRLSGGVLATRRGLGVDPATDATTAISLAALWRAATTEEARG
jgi:hypothetical protein